MPSRTFDITIAFHFFQNFHQSVPRTALVLVKDINFLSDVLSESLVRKSVMSLCPPQWCRVASKLCFICSLLWIHGSLLVGGQARLGGPHFRPLLALWLEKRENPSHSSSYSSSSSSSYSSTGKWETVQFRARCLFAVET